jgi:hypothetical protein
MIRVFGLTVAIAVCALGAFAQDDATAGGVPVKTVVTAEGRHNKPAPQLVRDEVMAFQGRDRAPIAEWTALRDTRAALELYILIDDSSDTTLASQYPDLRRFIEGQPASTQIAIGYMRNGTVITGQGMTSDHALASKGLRMPMGYGAGSSPYLSLSELIKKWPESAARREVLMISNGFEPLGDIGPQNLYVQGAIDHAQRAGILVSTMYTTGAGHAGHSFYRANWGQNYLSQIAEETGGESYMLGLGSPVSLDPYLKDFAQRLQNQYLVTVRVKPGKKAGFERIHFTTETPNVDVMSSTHVYVPLNP